MAKLPTVVKDNLEAERSHWLELRDKADSAVIDARAALAKARKERATADDMLAGLNRALGLREDGTPRTPRGKQVGVTLEPAPPAIEYHPLIVDAADLPAGMISLGPDGLQITPDASPDREE